MANTYTNTCPFTVTDTDSESRLTAADVTGSHTGYLVNNTHPLPKPLKTRATDAQHLGGGGELEPLTSPVTLLTWATPVSADGVTVTFAQPIAKTDGLYTGKYSKTVTVTLERINP